MENEEGLSRKESRSCSWDWSWSFTAGDRMAAAWTNERRDSSSARAADGVQFWVRWPETLVKPRNPPRKPRGDQSAARVHRRKVASCRRDCLLYSLGLILLLQDLMRCRVKCVHSLIYYCIHVLPLRPAIRSR